jgi:hypothetical protein
MFIVGKKNDKKFSIITKVGIKQTGDKIKKEDIGKNWNELLKKEWIVEVKKDIEVDNNIIMDQELLHFPRNQIKNEIKNEPNSDISEEKSMMDYTKKELIEMVKEKDIEVDIRMNKTKIIELLEKPVEENKIIIGAIKNNELK